MWYNNFIDLKNYLPESAVDYTDCFRRLASITNSAMDYVQNKDWSSDRNKNESLKRVAEAVETIASLRGDSGIFYDSRPEGLVEYQEEMYAIEDQLRARLVSLGYKYPSSTI